MLTGHDNGLITINLAEADDAERERRRHQMGEPYRTLLGHFRHEIAHYYWNILVANSPSIDKFRELFGDERADYGEALKDYYANGAPADWPERFVSAYASSHPWEDWAETWAHYFHMVDTLETAGAFGIAVKAKASQKIAAKIDFDPHASDMKRLIEGWLPLTFAVNSINRSMGLHDLYPFVLSPPAIAKLSFVHDRIRAQAGHATAPEGSLLAMIAGLRQMSLARDAAAPAESASPGAASLGGTGIGTQLVRPSKTQSWPVARSVMLSAIHTPKKTMTESTAKASAFISIRCP